MPISKIKGSAINDGAITIAKTDSLFVNTEIAGTEAAKMPVGTTAQRTSAQSGDIRFNTTIGLMEYYDGTNWKGIDAAPTVSSVSYPSGDALVPAGGETLTVVGQNFATVGSVSAAVDGSAFGTVTVNSSSSLTLGNSPAKTAGDYTLEITNPSGLSAQFTISYSGTPVWNTAVDTILEDIVNGDVVNNTTLEATDDGDSTGVTYAVTSGSLPDGLSLNSSTAAITGTYDGSSITGSTTYTFTVTATDNDNQTTARQFKITGSPNYFGDASDGDLNT